LPENRSGFLEGIGRGVAAACIAWLRLFPSAYGTTGLREPTINKGAFGNVSPDPKEANPPCIAAGLTAENGILAASKPFLRESASAPATGGTTISKIIPLFGFMPRAETFQLARWSAFARCMTKKSASGSPSCQYRFTDPGWELQDLISASACSDEIVRQATTDFNFSVSNRAVAASFSRPAARSNALLAVSPAFMPSLRASATLPSTVSLYASYSFFVSAFSCLVRITTDAEAIATAIAISPAPNNVRCRRRVGWN
jgi:hypothetical protein